MLIGEDCDQNIHDDVWYIYTAEACGDLTVESCGDTDAMDQMIAIYDASAGLPLLSSAQIGCGDDSCGIGAGPATVTVPVAAGTEYLIRVGGWNNEVPGGFIGSPRGHWDLHFSLDQNCPSDVVAPILACNTPGLGRAGGDCAAGEEPILKNRYISIRPGGLDDANPFDLKIRVTMTSSEVNGVTGIGDTYWAGAPVNGAGLSPATCISKVTRTDPGVIDWSGCPVVHLTGCSIIPTSTYEITAINAAGAESDEPLLADTQAKPGVKWHGDTIGFFNGTNWTPPNGTTSIDDAVAAIKTFQDPSAFNATHLSVSDVHPNLDGTEPNLIVSIADVFVIILGFQGQEYPGPDLTQCP